MEVRCEKCNKLFRVSDDKITGTGIKFPCTRCGAYVRIIREDFEQYTVSRGAVSVPDLFEPKRKPALESFSPEAADTVAKETAPPGFESQSFELAASSTDEEALEKKTPLFVEPDYLTDASAVKSEPVVDLKPEPFILSKPKTAPPVESQPEQKPEPLFVPRQKAKPLPERETPTEHARPTPPGSPQPEPPAQPAVSKTEYARPAAPPDSTADERTVTGPLHSSTPSHSGRMLLVMFLALIIAGLAYGIFVYFPFSPHKGKEAVHEIPSIEGMQIVNPSGTLDTNGDLLVKGIIENTAAKEKTAWLVILEVFDAQGTVLSKIRLLNGHQIYTRRDYDILAKRGANVPELKAKSLQEKGIVIPPKGTVGFELRYMEPPVGIASFNMQELPFDPVQLQKEIAEEIK